MTSMNRLFSLAVLFSILVAAIIIRLFYIQILRPDTFYSNNYLHTDTITAARGEIFDRNGEALVLNRTTYQAFALPKKITDKHDFIKKIDGVLKVGEATIEAKLDMSKEWIPLKSGVSQDDRKKLTAMQLEALGFDEQSSRFYPESSLAAQLLGFVGKDNEGDNTGYFGIEGFYSRDLSGLPGLFLTERDMLGKPIFVGTQDMVTGEDGRDLYLTIDKVVQHIAKSKLKSGIERFGAKEGCVIIANPKTMEILALSCLPDYDPDEYFKFSESYFTNPTITNLFEPGSIFKPLIMAAALNENVLKPTDTFNEDGPAVVSGYQIKTWDDKYAGTITFTRALEKSSNVGMVRTGERLGEKKLYSYLQKFGIGESTNIDLQGEVSGYFKPQKDFYKIDYATATFGQGLVVTPMQMIRAFAALLNGGYIMEPHVVKSLKTDDGHVKEINPKTLRRIFSDKTSLQIRSMLQQTVEHAEAKWDRPVGYKIGGKTGTAQVAVEGKYDASKTVASFIGFAPVDDPKFVALVIYKEPKSSPWGSETAAPTFFEIAKELLVYYNIAPDK